MGLFLGSCFGESLKLPRKAPCRGDSECRFWIKFLGDSFYFFAFKFSYEDAPAVLQLSLFPELAAIALRLASSRGEEEYCVCDLPTSLRVA